MVAKPAPRDRRQLHPAAPDRKKSGIRREKGGIPVSKVMQLLRRAGRQEGQGMVEYALILVLVSIVVIIILTVLGGTIQNVFDDIVQGL